MKMNLESLQDRKKWEEMGFKLPDYSVEKMIENTANNPEWIHRQYFQSFSGCSLSAFIK